MTVQSPYSSRLPPALRVSTRGRTLARIACGVFAVLGLLPFAVRIWVESPWVREWAARKSAQFIQAQGITATYTVRVNLWPLAAELRHVTVESTDGSGTFVTCDKIVAGPRILALLDGKFSIDQIELDSPHARIVVRDGKLSNFALKPLEKEPPDKKPGPFFAPFRGLAVSDGVVHLDVEGAVLDAHDIDVDVGVEDDAKLGSSFEISLAVSGASSHRTRHLDAPSGANNDVALDDDTLCGLEGRIRIDPGTIFIHRLTANGSADLDQVTAVSVACNLPTVDKRRVDLSFNHLKITLPTPERTMPMVNGHIQVRAPIAIAARLASLPDLDGWVSVNANVRFEENMAIPDVEGSLEAHGIRLDHFSFAQELESVFTVREGIVTSPRTRVGLAKGDVVLTQVEVRPLEPKIPITAQVDATNIDFTELMKDLGVARHPHVAWSINTLHLPRLSGTINPLDLEGAMSAQTSNFKVCDRAIDDPSADRIIGFESAALVGSVAVLADALEFRGIQATLPNSTLEGGFVSLAYESFLKLSVPHGHVDLADISPIGNVPFAGIVDVELTGNGPFSDPHLAADLKVSGLALADLSFGDIDSAHVTFSGTTVRLENIRATKGKSPYEVPSARLEFGGPASVEVDAFATSKGLGARDLLAMFHLEDDSRFLEIDATLTPQAEVHIALGGPEDRCGGGAIDIRVSSQAEQVSMFGEKFDDGNFAMRFHWIDRLAGLDGADILIDSIALRKVRRVGGKTALGSVFGSVAIQNGGQLSGSLVIDGVPLARLNALGPIAQEAEGSLSGVVRLAGTIEAFQIDSEVDVTPVRLRGTTLGGSRIHLELVQFPSTETPIGKTVCGGLIYPPVKLDAVGRDDRSTGVFVVNGTLFNQQVRLDHVTMSRQKFPKITGVVRFDKLDLEAVGRVAIAPPSISNNSSALTRTEAPLTGELSGELTVDDLTMQDPSRASIRLLISHIVMEHNGRELSLRPTNAPLIFAHDVLTIPSWTFDLEAPNGLKGSALMNGTVTHPFGEADVNLALDLTPIDLGVLSMVVPSVEHASGKLEGNLKLKGKVAALQADGHIRIRDGNIALVGWPSAFYTIELEVKASETEIRLERATAGFAGGTVTMEGAIPVRYFTLGAAEAKITARDIHLTPSDGVSVTLDADLAVLAPPAALPRVSGDVVLTSAQYTRNINLVTDLTGFRVGATRTVVDTYDPSLDLVTFDLHVRARSPLRIHNNLVELQLDIGRAGLAVTGTNQRVGLRGELRSQPGGRFHFRSTDFDIRQALIMFDDPSRIAPKVDVVATTEYRRASDTNTPASIIANASGTGGIWRITLHAFGDADHIRFEMTSDPALSQDDIALLLTIGMTRAEIYQLQAGAVGASFAFEALATASGADRAVKEVLPIIDDFRFGSGYSPQAGQTVPQLTVGKRITDSIRASVMVGLSEERDLRANIEWRLGKQTSVQGSYDNMTDVSSSSVGNIGLDFRWRLEFE